MKEVMQALKTVFVQVEDPRVERTKTAPVTGYSDYSDLWRNLRSRRMGGD